MKQLKGDAKSARVSFPAACCDKTNFTFIDTPRLAAGRFIRFRMCPPIIILPIVFVLAPAIFLPSNLSKLPSQGSQTIHLKSLGPSKTTASEAIGRFILTKLETKYYIDHF
jgi:hypothetical protein